MKRQVQETGIRRWFGDDYINMQNELYEAIESFFKPYGNMIIRGCLITDIGGSWRLGEGLVGLYSPTGDEYRICRVAQTDFDDATVTVYLTLTTELTTRAYKTGGSKTIVKEYKAQINTVQPGSGEYLTINANDVGNITFRDAVQSSVYRFVTDTMINTWNAKLTASAYNAADVLAKLLTVDGTGSNIDADRLDGQHGSYYLPAGTYTAADILTKIKTVDGAGTGLDADLLDGQHGSYYLPAGSYTAADLLAKLLTVDGAASGIDADKLDGQHGSYYLPAGSYTAADLLAKLLTVDGAASGIDSDMLDGIHGSGYSIAGNIYDGDLDLLKRQGTYRVNNSSTNLPVADRFFSLLVNGNNDNVTSQVAIDYITGEMYARAFNTGWSSWLKLTYQKSNGYVQIGDVSPFIKVKKLTGTTYHQEGGAVYIPHGLTRAKIIHVSVTVVHPAKDYYPHENGVGVKFIFRTSETNVEVINDDTSSEYILGVPIKVFIIYEE